MLVEFAFIGLGLELEREIHRRIVEAGDRGKGDAQLCGSLIEAQSYLEPVLADLEIPESILNDNRHFVGKPVGKMLRHLDAGGGGLEGDVKMMLSGKPSRRLDLAKYSAHHGAQRFLDDLVIRDQTVGRLLAHGPSCNATPNTVKHVARGSRPSYRIHEGEPEEPAMPIDATLAYENSNIFARILRGEIPCRKVYEDDYALAFHDINPQAPIHILVIPKGAYVSWDDFSTHASETEIAGFVRAIGQVARERDLVTPGYRLLSNAGPASGQEVPHLHVHIFGGRGLGPMLVSAPTE